MLASKPEKPRVSLKVVFKDDIPVGGLLFTFTNPSTAQTDRQRVQDLLIPHVSANRMGLSSTAPAATPATPSTPSGAAGAVQAVMSSSKGKRKADEIDGVSNAASPRGSAGTPGSGVGVGPAGGGTRRVGLNNLRKRVLDKNATLKMLHRELVLGGQITESEFWDGREVRHWFSRGNLTTIGPPSS